MVIVLQLVEKCGDNIGFLITILKSLRETVKMAFLHSKIFATKTLTAAKLKDSIRPKVVLTFYFHKHMTVIARS